MKIFRRPAVAGRFYPAEPEQLRTVLNQLVGPRNNPQHVFGIVVPHAGYMYSGHVAGEVYSRIQIPKRVIVLCPNHTGLGPPLSIMAAGSWETPLGDIEIDEELSRALISEDPDLKNDTRAHQFEHALEVQLPFLQYIAGLQFRFVPITLGTGNWTTLERLGQTIAKVIDTLDQTTLVVASSDMNHYESDEVTRVKDKKAIEQILKMDAAHLFDVVDRERISMCGYGPTVAMLTAARVLGATHAELVKYATSGEISGNYDAVVGYAGILIE